MKISVAMVTYNGERFLSEQLESILPQLGAEDELLISDDGSTDSTRAILLVYAARDRRIRLLDGPQAGVVKNVENALAATTGDLVFLCDQDDVWHPDKVAAVRACFEQHPDAGLCLHNARIVDEAGAVLESSFFDWRGVKRGFWKNVWKNSYIGCCMALTRPLLQTALPFPAKLPMHDQWIGLTAERLDAVVFLQQPLLDYRRHGDNATASRHAGFWQMLRWRWQILMALRGRRYPENKGSKRLIDLVPDTSENTEKKP